MCRLLDLDDRNFHGWAYRRFIVKLAGISAQDEVAYAKELINNNFSNYSAWHARTTLLHAVHAEGHVPSLTQLLETEPSGTGKSLHIGTSMCNLVQFLVL